MATAPTQDPRTVVKTTTVLWSQQVAQANADEELPQFDPAYKWNNGKEFVEKTHYQPANPP